jgi:hypothetical protein
MPGSSEDGTTQNKLKITFSGLEGPAPKVGQIKSIYHPTENEINYDDHEGKPHIEVTSKPTEIKDTIDLQFEF